MSKRKHAKVYTVDRHRQHLLFSSGYWQYYVAVDPAGCTVAWGLTFDQACENAERRGYVAGKLKSFVEKRQRPSAMSRAEFNRLRDLYFDNKHTEPSGGFELRLQSNQSRLF